MLEEIERLTPRQHLILRRLNVGEDAGMDEDEERELARRGLIARQEMVGSAHLKVFSVTATGLRHLADK